MPVLHLCQLFQVAGHGVRSVYICICSLLLYIDDICIPVILLVDSTVLRMHLHHDMFQEAYFLYSLSSKS